MSRGQVSEAVVLKPELQADIDAWAARYPAEQKQSAVLMALRMVQEDNGGHLTGPLMDAVATHLGMAKVAVYEVATFYSLYELAPVGRYKIAICTNISCKLCGADAIVKHIEKRLGIKMGETSKDGLFTLREVECLAACVGAPMLQINEQAVHENLTPAKVDAILDKLIAEA